MWIELEGLANLRDVGGMPTTDGGEITAGRLLRSDNLQALTSADIDRLLELGLTDVVDLRSEYEVESEGPGPLAAYPTVQIHQHSLFREWREGVGQDKPVELMRDRPEELPDEALPWVDLTPSVQVRPRGRVLLPVVSGRPTRLGARLAAAHRRSRRRDAGALRRRQGPDRHDRRPGPVDGRCRPRRDHRGLRREQRADGGDPRPAARLADVRREPARSADVVAPDPPGDDAGLPGATSTASTAASSGCSAGWAGPRTTRAGCGPSSAAEGDRLRARIFWSRTHVSCGSRCRSRSDLDDLVHLRRGQPELHRHLRRRWPAAAPTTAAAPGWPACAAAPGTSASRRRSCTGSALVRWPAARPGPERPAAAVPMAAGVGASIPMPWAVPPAITSSQPSGADLALPVAGPVTTTDGVDVEHGGHRRQAPGSPSHSRVPTRNRSGHGWLTGAAELLGQRGGLGRGQVRDPQGARRRRQRRPGQPLRLQVASRRPAAAGGSSSPGGRSRSR